MTDKIIDIISELVGADEGEIGADTELFDEGILDSFALVQLMVALEEQGHPLDIAELDREQVSTPAKIAALLA